MTEITLHKVCLNRRDGGHSCRAIPHSPNRLNTMHWGERARWKKTWEEEVGYSCLETFGLHKQIEGRVRIPKKPTIQVILYMLELMDADNAQASLKPIYDGLTKAGIIKDDSPEFCTILAPECVKVDKKDKERLIIKIT